MSLANLSRRGLPKLTAKPARQLPRRWTSVTSITAHTTAIDANPAVTVACASVKQHHIYHSQYGVDTISPSRGASSPLHPPSGHLPIRSTQLCNCHSQPSYRQQVAGTGRASTRGSDNVWWSRCGPEYGRQIPLWRRKRASGRQQDTDRGIEAGRRIARG